MNIKNIEFFVQLAQFEHVSVTADFLNMSQPALSKSISQLEDELGVKLFDRKGKRIKLNKNGENFLRYSEQILGLLNNAIMSTRSLGKEIAGKVSIVYYSYASILSECIADYHKLNPFTSFVMIGPKTEEHMDMSGNYDFILYSSNETLVDRGAEQFWISQPLFKEKFFLVASPALRHFPEEQTSVNLLDFKEDFFVTMSQNNVFFNDFTYYLCQHVGFFPHVSCQTDDFGIKMKTIQSGMAVGLLPESCIKDAKGYCPELRVFQIENANTERTVSLMRHRKSMMSESALDFWNFVLDFYQLPPDTSE